MLHYVFKPALNLYIQLGGAASLASPQMFTVTKWLAFSTNAIATVPLGIAIGILLRYLSVGQPVVCLIAFVVGINFLPLASISEFDESIGGPFVFFYGIGDFPLIQLVAAVVIFWRRLSEGAPPNNKLQRTRGGSVGEG